MRLAALYARLKNKTSIGSVQHERYGVRKQTGQAGRLAGTMRIMVGRGHQGTSKRQSRSKRREKKERLSLTERRGGS